MLKQQAHLANRQLEEVKMDPNNNKMTLRVGTVIRTRCPHTTLGENSAL